MEQNLAKQIKGLKIYAGFLTAALILVIALFIEKMNTNTRFSEITAQRINIAEEDGTIRMVISNQKRQHPGQMDGKMFRPREREAGMIFFNNSGDECGGLVFDGNAKSSGMAYSTDQYKNDQIMQLQYNDDRTGGKVVRSYGLKMWDRRDDFALGQLIRVSDSLEALHDTAATRLAYQKMRSDGLLGPERLFIGKTGNKEFGLFIKDDKGVPRIRIALDSMNHVILEGLEGGGSTGSGR